MIRVMPLSGGAVASVSDQGKRARNEDALFTGEVGRYRIFAVADGLGGHAAGDVASTMAIRILTETLLESLPHPDPGTLLTIGFRRANAAIYRYNLENGLNAGTTLTAALVDEKGICRIATVGDSRAYIVTRDAIWHTKDHSYVQELVDAGVIGAGEAARHPKKNILTQALGLAGTVSVDTYEKDLRNATLLLSTDGLHDYVPEERIWETLLSVDPGEACRRLVAAAKAGASSDNITAIVTRFC